MAATVDNPAGMAEKKKLKTFLADDIDFAVLRDAAELLSKARGANVSESDLIRRAIRAHTAKYALREAPRLLRGHLAELGESVGDRLRAERAETEVARLTEQLAETLARYSEGDSE